MAFADNPKKIILSCGEEITLPRMTIGKILHVTHALSELAKVTKKEFPDLLTGVEMDKDPGVAGTKILKALPEILPVVADQVVDLIASYLGKETAWVKDNMDLEDLSKVAFPFFEAFMAQSNHLVGAFNKIAKQEPLDKPSSSSNKPLQN